MNKSSEVKLEQERKGYKFRLIVPNSKTESILSQFVGSCRFVWNKALALIKQDEEAYNTAYARLSAVEASPDELKQLTREFKFNPYQQLSAMLPKWKDDKET